MGTAEDRLSEIFAEALTKPSPEERERFLAAACGPDAALRRQVESLLEAHAQAGDYLRQNVLTANGPAAGEGPGSVIGRYKLLQQIGEGGFGVVFMAEQQEPVRRMVALKIIKAGMDTKEVVARFEAERQALALMDHPNIAKVLDGGATASGRPYFVMDLVKGIPITAFCEQHQLPLEARLKLFLKVCAGVQHAHQKGVIHRDLKPTNVLVTLHDGEPVPKVIDFGIAKAVGQKLTERTLFTRFEQLLGTPAYMSPEQAEWSGLDVDTRSDLYSLGVLLYELLTSTTPLEKVTLARAALDEVRRMIREVEPPKPSTRLKQIAAAPAAARSARQAPLRNPSAAVDPDLDWIVMKCLEKNRTRRYETVNGLARDLERHLNGEPVVARPPSKAYLAGKFIRKHRVAVAAVAGIALALVLGLGLALVGFTQARRERWRAQASERASRRQLVQLELQEGTRRMDEDNYGEALVWYAEALRHDQGDPGREPLHRMRLGSLLDRHPRLLHLWALKGPVWRCAFSPDGKRLVASYGTRFAGPTLVLADLRTERLLWEVPQPSSGFGVPTLAFSPDGRRVILRAMDHTKVPAIYDSETGRGVLPAEDSGAPARLLDSPDGEAALIAVGPDAARVWDAATGRSESPFRYHAGNPVEVRFALDSRSFLTFSPAPFVKVWNREPAQLLVKPLEHKGLTRAGQRQDGWILEAGFSPKGRFVVSAGADGTARVWDLVTGEPVCLPIRHAGGVYAAGFSPSEDRLVTAGADGVVKVQTLARCHYPMDVIHDFAELLAGARKETTGAFMPLDTEQLADRFERLRRVAPEAFRESTPRQQALWHDEIATLARAERHWPAVIWHLDRVFQLDPGLTNGTPGHELLRRRGEARAELGDWRRAAEDFEWAVQLDPDRVETWTELVTAELAADRPDEYRRACDRMLRQFRRAIPTAPGTMNDVARACTFAPATVPDLETPAKMTEAIVAMYPEESGLLNTHGQVLYRAGRFGDAIRVLQQACALGRSGCGWADALFLAMAHAQLGQGTEARRFLDQADQIWLRIAKPADGSTQSAPDWHDRALFRALRREAAAVVAAGK